MKKLEMNRILNFFLIVGLVGLFYLSENLSQELKHRVEGTSISSEINPNDCHSISFNCIDYSKNATLPQNVSCAAPVILKVSFGGSVPFITSVFSKILYKTFCGYIEIAMRFSTPRSDLFIDFQNFRS